MHAWTALARSGRRCCIVKPQGVSAGTACRTLFAARELTIDGHTHRARTSIPVPPMHIQSVVPGSVVSDVVDL